MITTNLTGNFGNHMWYYTICRIVAEKLGYDWGINPIPTHDYFGGKNQMYFMDVDFGKKVEAIGKNQKGLNKYRGIENEYYDVPKSHSYAGNSCLINMYDSGVFNIKDNTMVHLISQSEDYLIDRKEEIKSWFKIKDEWKSEYNKKLKELDINLDENTCIINFRGGEYRSVPNLIPDRNYWANSISYMRSINPNIGFVIITDDPPCATQYIGNYPCYHVDIGFDFWAINQSQYTILSNSSFGFWAAWLGESKKIIAPRYWSQHNTSNGYWGLGDQYVTGFDYMDRDGKLINYNQCKEEALIFYKKNNLI